MAVALIAFSVVISGCTPIDPDELPGVYRNEETGGEVVLDPDGTFSVTGVSAEESVGGGGADPADFSGRWEFVDSETTSDFVYLTVDDDGLGKIGGLQLYPNGRGEVKFRPDPDGPPSLVLTKVDAP